MGNVEARSERFSAVQRLVDRIVRLVARQVALAWFREVEVQGLERLEDAGPVVVAANHANGFVDPLVLVATSPRPLRFLAKSSLWKVPGLGVVLDVVGALPVRRAKDVGPGGGPLHNESTFSASHSELARGGCVAIFPEGTVNDTPRVLPLKTGAARIALGARDAGTTGVRLLPVGLVYREKARPRTRVLVRVGSPIELDEVVPQLVATLGDARAGGDAGDHALVEALTRRLAAGLQEAGLHLEGIDEPEVLALAAAASLRARDPLGDPARPVPIAAIEPLVRRMASAPEEQRRAVIDAQAAYQGRLALLGLRDVDVLPGNTEPRLERSLRAAQAKVTVLAPASAVGIALNGVPYLVVRTVARRPMARVSRANTTVLAGIVAFPLAWAAWGWVGFRQGVRHPWRWAFVLGPLTARALVLTSDQLSDVRAARLGWEHLVRAQDLLDEVRGHREKVVAAVDAAVGAEATPPAATPAAR